jgi:hypothetical protein
VATAVIMIPAMLVLTHVAEIDDLPQPWRALLAVWCLSAFVWGTYRMKEDAISEGKCIQHREWLKAISPDPAEPPFTDAELAWMKGSKPRLVVGPLAEVELVREQRTMFVNRCASVVGKPSVTPDEAEQAWAELNEALAHGAFEDAKDIITTIVEKSGKERQ